MKRLNESYASSVIQNTLQKNRAVWVYGSGIVNEIQNNLSDITDDNIICVYTSKDKQVTYTDKDKYNSFMKQIKSNKDFTDAYTQATNSNILSVQLINICSEISQTCKCTWIYVLDRYSHNKIQSFILIDKEGSLKILETYSKHHNRTVAKYKELDRNIFTDQDRGREFIRRRKMNITIPKILGETYKVGRTPIYVCSAKIPGKKFPMHVTGISPACTELTIGAEKEHERVITISFNKNENIDYAYVSVRVNYKYFNTFGIDYRTSYVMFEKLRGSNEVHYSTDETCSIFAPETAKALAIQFANYLGVDKVDFRKMCAIS